MDEKAHFNTETYQTKENGIKGSERAYMDKYEEKDFKSVLLDTAKSLITGERARQHGNIRKIFPYVAKLWSAYLSEKLKEDVVIEAYQVPLMLDLLKVGRVEFGEYNVDDHQDSIGYKAISGELHTLFKKNPLNKIKK